MFQKGGYFHYCSPLAGSREFLKIAEHNYGINVEDFAKKGFHLAEVATQGNKDLSSEAQETSRAGHTYLSLQAIWGCTCQEWVGAESV